MNRRSDRPLTPSTGARLGRRVAALLLVLGPVVALALPVSPAMAADCAGATVPQLAKHATGVFRGQVTAVGKPVTRQGKRVKFVKVTVARVFKGSDSPTTMRIRTTATQPVRKGDYFVFVTKAAKQWQLVCGGAVRATPSVVGQAQAALGNGTAIAPKPPTPPVTSSPLELQPTEQHAPKRFRQMAAPGAALVLIGLLGLMLVRRQRREG